MDKQENIATIFLGGIGKMLSAVVGPGSGNGNGRGKYFVVKASLIAGATLMIIFFAATRDWTSKSEQVDRNSKDISEVRKELVNNRAQAQQEFVRKDVIEYRLKAIEDAMRQQAEDIRAMRDQQDSNTDLLGEIALERGIRPRRRK